MRRWMVVGLVVLGGCVAASDVEPGSYLVEELKVRNPVERDCADPSVLRHADRWYLTCTGGKNGNAFPIFRSDDLLEWTFVSWVFTPATKPTWAEGHYWAPELHHVPGGVAVYFSALHRGRHVIGAAKATTILGTYVDRGTPLVKRDYSAIDAHVFLDGDTRYLYWKGEHANDAIYARKLSADGMSLSPQGGHKVLAANRSWEGHVVEAPWVTKRGDWYYLFYSGAAYCNSSYAVGVARSQSPFGPFTKKSAPILRSGHRWAGPGHNSVTKGPDGNLYAIYHAYKLAEGTPRCAGSPDNNARHTLIDRIEFANGWPDVTSNL